MNEITVGELFELYLDTISKCTVDLRNRSREEMEYNLFEEFDVGAHSFLHEDNLVKLYRAGYIDDEIWALSKELRERWISLQEKPCSISEMRTNKEWQEFFALCHRLRLKATYRHPQN